MNAALLDSSLLDHAVCPYCWTKIDLVDGRLLHRRGADLRYYDAIRAWE